MFNWFRKQSSPAQPLRVDIHSHLLPAVDDGSQSLDESEDLIRNFQRLGYRKLITTPHIMSDAYRNTPDGIAGKLRELREHLVSMQIDMVIEAAAEYYLDETLMQAINTRTPLLTFGNKYLLFETNFLSEPLHLKEFIFRATTQGYRLILAHPERYLYLQENILKAEDLLNRGVLFQLNISSVTGYYSKPVQQMAFRLIDRGWVHWLGSDCHHAQHLLLLEDALSSKYLKKALNLPLLNNTLQ